MNEWPELSGICDDIPPAPGPEAVHAALTRSALDGAETWSRPRPYRAWALLAMEARMLRPVIWLLSALVMAVAIGAGYALVRVEAAEFVLALAAPLVAAAGVATLYGPEQDDAFELVAVTPTSPRVVLLARVTLVFGYDLLLALLASVVLAPLSYLPAGLSSLIATWLGPMAALAALTLLLAVCWNPGGAMGGALAVWSLYALTFTDVPVLESLQRFWTTGPPTVGLALALAIAAAIMTGTGEPIRRARATHRS
ncbi:hypothetical protein OHA77_15310 [Streptosporangium sp. NBC_01639]|uniref:hypothetical protein n=1 Tax=Streptosporangium sp. NBC_01639 TaxID=2975948 RepID=UPI003870E8F1|nr:hypothetical protein OHA77_15310 [Streptosporangium sp. NBC_01639]